MWIISAASLGVTMLLCVLGVFIPKVYYDDNLAQRIGMAGVFIFCWPRLVQLLEAREITGLVVPVPAQLAGHVGLAMFAVGTAYKVWKHRPGRGQPRGPNRRREDARAGSA
jgi:hypothetical protein